MPATRKKSSTRKKRKQKTANGLWDTLLGHLFGEHTSWEPPRFYPDPPPAQSFDEGLLQEILREGYRTLAKRYHPDLEGGDAAKMTELNRIKAELRF